MWKLILVLASLSNVFASEWSIQKDKSETVNYIIVRGNQSYDIEDQNVVPKIIQVKKYKHLEIIVFHAATIGTSFMYNEYWAVIYDLKQSKFLGEYPHNRELISQNSDNIKVDQPQWNFKENSIEIILPDEGITEILNF